MSRQHWTKDRKCGFCHNPEIVPYTRELGGGAVIGEIGLCKRCKAVFCRDHGMIGLVECIGLSKAGVISICCRKRMCPKCSKQIGEKNLKGYVCDECHFLIAERELST